MVGANDQEVADNVRIRTGKRENYISLLYTGTTEISGRI
jgi:hypothetical protein